MANQAIVGIYRWMCPRMGCSAWLFQRGTRPELVSLSDSQGAILGPHLAMI